MTSSTLSSGVTKAYLTITSTSTKIPCLFNPESLSISKSNSWGSTEDDDEDELPTGGSELQFNSSSPATMSLSLIFDTTDTGSSVVSYTGTLMALMDPDTSSSEYDEANGYTPPPTVTFTWGSFTSWECVIESMSINYTYWSSSGDPLRASVEMGLKQYKEDEAFGPQNPTSRTLLPHRVHQVQPGETLDRISAKYYGDPTMWRQLAAANGLEDPLAVRPGTVLAIPRRGGE
jgi:hypothetical protein